MAEVVHVVGSGIIGLGVALRFRNEGHQVHVFSRDDYFFPTSPVSAAFWYPYACSLSDDEARRLSAPTHAFFQQCVSDRHSGVEFRCGYEYFDATASDRERSDPWWSQIARAFRQLGKSELPDYLQNNEVIGPFIGAWHFEIPVVNMRRFLPWLAQRLAQDGVAFHRDRVASIDSHLKSNECSIFVNCTGGWATWLTVDPSLVGVQGVVVEVEGEPFGPDVLVVENGKSAFLPTYIVPQGERTVLGGTLQEKTDAGARWAPGDKSLWTPADSDIRGIISRCSSLVREAPEIRSFKAIAGLRPRRIGLPPLIRSEARGNKLVIHNFGHGGAGVSTFWGSANQVYSLYEAWRATRA